MDSSNVARTKRSFYGGTRSSPYAKLSLQQPNKHDSSARSGLFSRMVGFFRTPKLQTDDNKKEEARASRESSPVTAPRRALALYPVIDGDKLHDHDGPQAYQNDSIISDNSYLSQSASTLTPPRNKRVSVGMAKSPNQRLAEFFHQKGNAPLTDIETAGVMSLINQAAGEDPVLAERLSPVPLGDKDRSLRHSMSLASLAGPNGSYKSPSKIPRLMHRTSSDTSRGLKKSRSLVSLNSKDARASPRASIGGGARPGVRGLPTPILAASNNSPKRQRTKLLSPEKPASPSEQESAPASPKRPLSGVATTLLSLIDDDEDEEVKRVDDTQAPKEFINPYSSSPQRTHRSSASPKPKNPSSDLKSPSQIINNTMPLEHKRDRDNAKIQPQIKKFEKYKPAVSSNLRPKLVDSEVQDLEAPPTKSISSVPFSNGVPSTLTFGSKSTSVSLNSKSKSSSPSGDEDTDVKIGKDLASSAVTRSPSKPLYPEISKDMSVPSTPKLAKAGLPLPIPQSEVKLPQSEAVKKFGKDFNFDTPSNGEILKPLTESEKAKVVQFKQEYVF